MVRQVAHKDGKRKDDGALEITITRDKTLVAGCQTTKEVVSF